MGFILYAVTATSFAQTVTLGSAIVQDYLRREQLKGSFDSTFSFNYRPIVFSKNGIDETNLPQELSGIYKPIYSRKSSKVALLPLDFRIAYDHDHPDSRNDGAMIRSRGLQTYLSAGIYAELGPLSIQLKPEFIFAENNAYQGFPEKPRHWESTWLTRYAFWNQIDEPERYGTDSYYKLLPGQSSIRLNKWGLSLGLSTENIWWGPSRRNSLMMSHNAQGFAHITLNTQRPIKTAIGSFEGQFITGRLEASDYNPPAADQTFRGFIAFIPKPDDWRYLQAVSFSYSPKWIKGLSLGITRWVQQYYETVKETNDYFPAFSNLFRNNDNNVTLDEQARDQAASIFGRWIWYDSKAEFYFEFGKNDAAANLRDLLVDTDHSRALTVGINKLFPTSDPDADLQFNFEWTQMSQTESRFARNAGAWYHHSSVRDGYTNNGEVLGSGLGPGGNGQYLELSWLKGLKKIGGAIERRVHNNDFMTAAFSTDFTRYWVDYNIYGFLDFQYQKMLISVSAFYTHSLNYQWEVRFDPNGSPFQYRPGKDRNNLNLDFKILYTF
ncbi:hypothetical protein BFP97_13510 [Roseivirga sp. 4D4]|nr:hypothetical protein BFP97_13510 [Roseivirga sp. 4D4]